MNRESTGTQERKRAAKAIPPRQPTQHPGCLLALLVYLAVCGSALWYTRSWFWAVLALPATLALVIWIRSVLAEWALLAKCWNVLAPQGIRFLVVYSESPVWEAHVRSEWLPRFGRTVVLLNWTERASWDQRSVEVRLFNHFIKAGSNFNPAVLVLRGSNVPWSTDFIMRLSRPSTDGGITCTSLKPNY